MNALENYKAVLDRHFGNGTATFDTGSGVTNNAIGALNHVQFATFRSAFLHRLNRLASTYPAGNPNRPSLLQTLNEIATANNWEGAYAELVAFDFLNSDKDWLDTPISLSQTLPATDTLAANLGLRNVNLDGYYDDFRVFFDVKVLSDKSRDILDGIISETKRHLAIPSAVITPEYPLDTEFEAFETNRPRLAAELRASIDVAAKTTLVQSNIVPDLAYRILWGAGVLTSIATYDPYLHAANHHKLLFKHAKKFSKVRPAFIVFVVFPWLSETTVTQLDCKQVFFRSFCRRFFLQYAEDHQPAQSVLGRFQGTETVAQITDKLTGVIFLDDQCVTCPDPSSGSVRPYVYLNPNAVHKVSGHFRDYLSNLNCAIDDFENDNY